MNEAISLLTNRLHFNALLIPTLLIGIALWWFAFKKWKPNKAAWCLAGLLAIPGILFPLYYLHWFDGWSFFYIYRTWPFTELTAAGMGLLAGFLHRHGTDRKWWSGRFIPGLLLFALFIPHAKPILFPLDYARLDASPTSTEFQQYQSVGVSCGPASMATLLAHDPLRPQRLSEAQIAKQAHTYSRGTEVWYLGRLFKELGYTVRFSNNRTLPDQIQVPCIAGVDVGSFGHFIPILGVVSNRYVVGDPMESTFAYYDREELERAYTFTGFFMTVEHREKNAEPP